jgi:hypothetical protein
VQTGFRSFSKGLEGFNQLNASNAIIPYEVGAIIFANTFILFSKTTIF